MKTLLFLFGRLSDVRALAPHWGQLLSPYAMLEPIWMREQVRHSVSPAPPWSTIPEMHCATNISHFSLPSTVAQLRKDA